MITVTQTPQPTAELSLDDPVDEPSPQSAFNATGRGNAAVGPEEAELPPPARLEPFGGLTSAAVYDEVRRRLALRGYRWE